MPVYSLITDNGYCHVKGSNHTKCLKFSLNLTLSKCEAACTAHKPCVGYEYHERATLCYLIPSSTPILMDMCPEGYTLAHRIISAETSNDLEAVEAPGMVCYGKNLGNSDMPRFYNSILRFSYLLISIWSFGIHV